MASVTIKLQWMLAVLATASVSYTLARAGVFAPIRIWIHHFRVQKLSEFIECPYCMAHWVCFFFAGLIGEPFAGQGATGWLLTIFAVMPLVAAIHYVMLRTYDPVSAEHRAKEEERMVCARIADEAGSPEIAQLIWGEEEE